MSEIVILEAARSPLGRRGGWLRDVHPVTLGARVLFRTAGEPTILPGRVPDDVLGRWTYRAEESLDYTRRDRSSIYGGVHLYVLGDAA